MLVSTDTISTTESAFFTYWFSRRPVMLGIFAQTVERTAPPKKRGKRGEKGEKGKKGEKGPPSSVTPNNGPNGQACLVPPKCMLATHQTRFTVGALTAL